MKKLSIFQTVLIAVFAAVAVASVLIFALAVGGGDSNSLGTVRIWGTLDQNAFTTVIRQAAENNPSFNQVTYEQKRPETYYQDVTNALASGTGPDLYLLREDYAFMDASKIIGIPDTAISASQFQSAFIDGASPFLGSSGAIAVPIVADPLVLYWNKDTLSAAGYAQAPKFWDEIYDMTSKVGRRSETGNVVKASLAFGEFANVNNAKEIVAMLIMQAGGSITARDTAGNLVSAVSPRTGETTQSTANALRFYTGFADPSKLYYTWNRALPESRKAFAAGDLALYIGLASEEPLIRRTNPNLNFAIAPMPQIRGSTRSIVSGHVYAFAVPRTSQNPNGALSVALQLAGAANAQSLSTALGMPPVRRDLLSAPAQGNDALFGRQAIILKSWIDPNPDRTTAIFRDMIQNTVSGASLVTEAVQRADQEMAEILGQ